MPSIKVIYSQDLKSFAQRAQKPCHRCLWNDSQVIRCSNHFHSLAFVVLILFSPFLNNVLLQLFSRIRHGKCEKALLVFGQLTGRLLNIRTDRHCQRRNPAYFCGYLNKNKDSLLVSEWPKEHSARQSGSLLPQPPVVQGRQGMYWLDTAFADTSKPLCRIEV